MLAHGIMRRLGGNVWGRRTWAVVGLAFVASLLLLAAGFAWTVPVPETLLHPAVDPGTRTLLDARGEPLAELADGTARSRHPVALDAMGTDLPRFTVALEDRRFYTHAGVDGRALAGSLWGNLRAGRVVSGASTITQQLVKLARGRPGGRNLLTKAREAVAAWKLERRADKPTILGRYLNSLSYGNRLIGPEAAARAYFGKPARSLTPAEALFLAGLPQAPSRLNPWAHPAAAEFRYGRNVRRLAAFGLIPADEARRLADAPPKPARLLPTRRAGHFVDLVVSAQEKRQKAESRTHIAEKGEPEPASPPFPPPSSFHLPPSSFLRTTLDPDLQRVAETLVRRHREDLRGHVGGEPQAAVVIVENATGAVRALVGSGDYADRAEGQVNGAVRPRSAGSTLKPFLYLTALDRRQLTAATILPDTAEAVRATFADYDPQNYHAGRHLGPARVRVALGSSLNVPAVVALGRFVGARPAFYEFGRWGFRFPATLDEYGAGFILGNAETRLLDLAAAYAGLSRGGLAGPARLLAAESVPFERVASTEACAIITDILCDPEARRATFGTGSPLDFPDGVRVAVKTGTSSGFRDKWCVGFTGRHTVAVWTGHFDGRPMDEAIAIHAGAPLWHALVDHLLRERHDPPVPVPVLDERRLVRRDVCPFTGLLPAPEAGGPAGVPELFLAGTEPTASAADRFNPHLRLPAEYAAWCAGPQNWLEAVADLPPADAGAAPLTILSPAEGARYALDPELPARQQMLEFRVQTPLAETAPVRWTVEGQPVEPQPDGRVFWPLVRGTWNVGAELSGTGVVARRRLEVE